MSTSPTISIAMPVYNEEQFLHEALDSLLAQTCGDFEIILSDNASTDSTEDICRKYMRKDSRIIYHRNEANIGSIKNLENSLCRCSGEFLFFASGHDRWAPNYLEACLALFRNHSDAVLVYTKGRWIESDGSIGDTLGSSLETFGLGQASRFCKVVRHIEPYAVYGLYRRDVIEKIYPLKDSLGPDLLMLGELALLGAFGFVEDTTFYMRRTHDIALLQKHLLKIGKKLGRVQSPRLCIDFYRHHYTMIRTYGKNRFGRLRMSFFATLSITRRWYRLLLFILLAGWFPNFLNKAFRMMGKLEPLDHPEEIH